MVVVDPTNENIGINDEGQVVGAVRMAPIGTPFEKMKDAPIIGYGKLTIGWGSEDDS